MPSKRFALVDPAYCVACGCCVKVCPMDAISVWRGVAAQADPIRCVGCGKCAESCPAGIIRIENKKAKFRKKGCISCFCCQEMCPKKAIYVRKAL